MRQMNPSPMSMILGFIITTILMLCFLHVYTSINVPVLDTIIPPQGQVEETRPIHEGPALRATSRYTREITTVTHANNNRQLNYYWYEPRDWDRSFGELPLIVILHGSTGNAYAGSYLTETETAIKYPAYIMIPMIPKDAVWSHPTPTTNVQELPHVVEAILSLVQSHPIDKKRIYIVGCSMGGHGVFGASVFFNTVFAAGVSISGTWPAEDAPQMTKMPLLIMAGSKDNTVPIQSTHNIARALKAANAPVKYAEFELGHYCPSPQYYTSEVWDWLFAQKMK